MITTKIKKMGKSKKLSFILIASLVLGLLIIAGPAKAFEIKIGNFSNPAPRKGEIVSTIATIRINSNERINIEENSLLINDKLHCKFNAEAKEVNCDGVTIKLVSKDSSEHGYGYDYGYGYGYSVDNKYGYRYGYANTIFTYNITVNTSEFDVGNYKFKLKVVADGKEYFSEHSVLNIISSKIGVPPGQEKYLVSPYLSIKTAGGSKTIEFDAEEYIERPNLTLPSGLPSYGKYFEIKASDYDFNNVEIRFYYKVAGGTGGLAESRMRLYYYDQTLNQWVLPSNNNINTGVGYTWIRMNELPEIWGIFEAPQGPRVKKRSVQNFNITGNDEEKDEKEFTQQQNNQGQGNQGQGNQGLPPQASQGAQNIPNTGSGITGAVIGSSAGRKTLLGVAIVFIFAILIALVVVSAKKKR
jgi:hypothetical protein